MHLHQEYTTDLDQPTPLPLHSLHGSPPSHSPSACLPLQFYLCCTLSLSLSAATHLLPSHLPTQQLLHTATYTQGVYAILPSPFFIYVPTLIYLFLSLSLRNSTYAAPFRILCRTHSRSLILRICMRLHFLCVIPASPLLHPALVIMPDILVVSVTWSPCVCQRLQAKHGKSLNKNRGMGLFTSSVAMFPRSLVSGQSGVPIFPASFLPANERAAGPYCHKGRQPMGELDFPALGCRGERDGRDKSAPDEKADLDLVM